MRPRFQVLGEVGAARDGASVDLGSPQQRVVVAALVLAAPHPVAASKLIDAVWGEAAPRTALATLRTYVSRLRSVLGEAALVSVPGGYALAECRSDLAEFTELTGRAAAEPDAARALLRRALDLWRGEALAGLPGAFALAQRTRLATSWLAAVEDRLALDVEQGDSAEAIAELTALCAEHPRRERPHGLLMLALYRAGRQAEALAVFEDLRRQLAEELGTEPSPTLAELRVRILRTDASLGGGGGARAEAVAALPRPAQLPGAVGDFTGRESLVSTLVDQLGAESPTLVISAVAGIGGVGKTTLAVHVAQRSRLRYPDGQLYVDLRGAGPQPMDPGVALAGMLRSLGITETAIPDDLDDRAALFRSTVADKRLLLLLDNAAGVGQVRPLLPGAPGCAVLITSRARLSGQLSATCVDLDVLEPSDALLLFTRILGADRVAPERPAATDLVAACGFLPLAIRIAAARLVARPNWTIATLADRLRVERRRLAELSTGGDAVTAAFASSYEQLDAEPARAFRLLAVPDAPEVSLPVAAALLETSEADAEDLAESLVDLHLLEPLSPGRYRYHDLVRLFARSRTPAAERDDGLTRYLDFQLATAVNWHRRVAPAGERYLEGVTATTSRGTGFADRDEARRWHGAIGGHVLPVAVQAATVTPQCTRLAADLLRVLSTLYASKTHGDEYRLACEAVAAAARDNADPRSRGRALLRLCDAYLAQGDTQAAVSTVLTVRELAAESGDRQVYAEAGFSLANVRSRQGRREESVALQTEIIEQFTDDGWTGDAAVILANRATTLSRLGRVDQALDDASRAVATLREHDDDSALALGLGQRCQVLLDAGRFDEAAKAGTEGAERYRALGNLTWEAILRDRVATATLRSGRANEAIAVAERVVELCQGTATRLAHVRALTTLGEALILTGRARRAEVRLHQALDLAGQLADAGVTERINALLARLRLVGRR